ncbi:BMP family ABC transporter substrate-binding protein [Leucobacter allii]|uniref:BMP family ABC transporter substrate-binding protein n=1 Tax=Leucobacter allii TaxID=2932247 RepID=A0ABY4FH05_9MICO|nr:BMP family ABC transporter substrate-binding protein [Leucobacter allii]UOQ55798.1 BMP family ABC transporter substrate-binding protein [Leucobacter allii]UOR00310.1 BMP family ABC transporter substrate-binding protein [Leucobacter allii]
MKRTRALLIAPVAVTLLAVTACSGGATDGAASGGDKAALVIAQGGLGDQSYNDLANAGFESALDATGISGNTIESDDVVGQGEQLLRRAGQSGVNLVVDLEYSHNEIIGSVAQDFPDTDWVIVNAEAEGDNVASVLFQEQEGSYLAGALAALQTSNTDDPRINEDKVIGVIGGTAGVGIDKFLVGFIQGAKDVDPDVEVLTAYSNDFGDPAKGQQLAQSMFEKGADIVYSVAGGTGAGVIQAAEEANHYAIGVDDDQDGQAPGTVLTSVLKRTDLAVETLVQDFADGAFPGGETVSFGLKEDAVGLTDFEYTKDAIPQSTLDTLDELRQGIIDGDITVWNVVTDGYPDFYSGS